MNVKNLEKSLEHSKIIQDLKNKPPSPIVVATIIVLAIVIFNVKIPSPVEPPDYGGEPEIQWVTQPGSPTTTVYYSGGRVSGFSGYVHFRNIGDSGRVQFTASVINAYSNHYLSTSTRTFYVEEGEQYTLTIRGRATEGYSTYEYLHVLRVTTPSASSAWQASLGYFEAGFSSTITSMTLS